MRGLPTSFKRDLLMMIGSSLGALVVCVLIRAFLLIGAYPPQPSVRGAAHFAKSIAIYSAVDVATLLAVLAFFAALLIVTIRQRALRRVVWAFWAIVLAAILILAVISVGTIPMYRWPLTLQLLRYSRVFSDRTGLGYIASLVPRSVYILLLLAIALPIVGGALGSRFARTSRSTLFRTAGVVAAVGSVYFLIAVRSLAGREDDYLFRNAAVELAVSTATPPIDALVNAAEPRAGPLEPTLTGQPPQRPQTLPKNVIFFVIESLGAEYVDGFGGSFGAAPNLNRLLAHGISISEAYAHSPNSTVALTSMLQSSVPLSLEGEHTSSVPNSLISVARAHGMRTAFFASGVPYDDELAYLSQLKVDMIEDSRQIPCPTKHSRSLKQTRTAIDNRCALSAMLSWIDRERAPFLTVLWNYQTHYPYYADRLSRRFAIPAAMSDWYARSLNLYLNSLQETDAALGELVDQLDAWGIAGETLIIVLGDHGEAFGQHGMAGHGFDVFEESIHIPVAMLYPGFEDRARYDDLFGEIDLAPSVASLLGFAAPPEWRGIDIFTGKRNRRLFFFVGGRDTLVGYRERDTKTIICMPQPGLSDVLFGRLRRRRETFSRYDLRADPDERKDLGISDARQQSIAKQRLARWAASSAR